ncbi:hypothetical protein PTTG_11514, partial [Puccinia triticina 1-1 BBBD Race 1]
MRRGYNPVRLYPLPKPADSSYKEIKKTHPTQADYEAAEKNIQENFTKLNYGQILLLEKGGLRKIYFQNNPSLNRNNVENEDRESPNDDIEGSPNDDCNKESSNDDAEGSTDDDAEGSTDDDYNKEYSYD